MDDKGYNAICYDIRFSDMSVVTLHAVAQQIQRPIALTEESIVWWNNHNTRNAAEIAGCERKKKEEIFFSLFLLFFVLPHFAPINRWNFPINFPQSSLFPLLGASSQQLANFGIKAACLFYCRESKSIGWAERESVRKFTKLKSSGSHFFIFTARNFSEDLRLNIDLYAFTAGTVW